MRSVTDTRKLLKVGRIKFNPEQIGASLYSDAQSVIENIQDGRVASRWAEGWVARWINAHIYSNTNEPYADLYLVKSSRVKKISVKCLTKKHGVDFRTSRYKGTGRDPGGLKALIDSLTEAPAVAVVDISQFPVVDMYYLDTDRLIEAAHNGDLKASGWSKERFQAFVEHYYRLSVQEIQIDQRAAAVDITKLRGGATGEVLGATGPGL